MWVVGSRPLASGFTLLELLVVLVIASLLLTIVSPRITAVIPGVELKTSTQQLAAILRYARSQAIAGADTIEVSLAPGKHQIKMTGSRKIYHWPESVDISHPSTNPMTDQTSEAPITLRFFPDGSADEGELLLTSAAGSYSISISWLTGRVAINE